MRLRSQIAPSWIALLLALVCLGGAAGAVDFYVDAAAGSDQTGIGSPTAPWATITHALGAMPPAGPAGVQTLRVNPGVYDTFNGESFPLTIPAGVRLVGAGPTRSVIYGPAGPGTAVLRFGAGTDGRTEITDLGIHAGDPGILIDGLAGAGAGPVVRLCRLSYNVTGMRIIAPTTGVRAPVVEECDLRANSGTGIALIGAGAGVIAGRIQDCWFDGNGGAGLDIDAGGGEVRTAVLGCALLGNLGDGIRFRGGANSGVTLSHVTVRASGAAGLAFLNGSPASGLAARNSIFHGNQPDLALVPAAAVSHCCFGTATGSSPPVPNQNGCLQADPRFARVGDPALSPFSPVIDAAQAGAPVDPPNDIHGFPRTADGDGDAIHAPDMGATEYRPLRDSGLTPIPGGVTLLSLDLPSHVSIPYLLGLAFSDTGMLLPGGRTLPLWPDPLFALVVKGQLPGLHDFAGILNTVGFARARIDWPGDARLRGLTFFCAGITVQSGFPGGIRCVTNGLALTLQ